MYIDVTDPDNITAGKWLGVPWPSDNAERFEARNLTHNCTTTGGSDSMCDGNRLEPSFYFIFVSKYHKGEMDSMEKNHSSVHFQGIY